MKPRTDWVARFWSRVEKTEGCWVWTGRTRYGYGQMDVPMGEKYKPRLAHRIASEIYDGPIPPGIYVLHHCDTPPCVRREHLYRGTQEDNMRDMVQRGRHRGGSRPGEACSSAKLTESQVLEIRRLYVPHVFGQKRLAAMFGVDRSTVQAIVTGQNWTHVGAGSR